MTDLSHLMDDQKTQNINYNQEWYNIQSPVSTSEHPTNKDFIPFKVVPEATEHVLKIWGLGGHFSFKL